MEALAIGLFFDEARLARDRRGAIVWAGVALVAIVAILPRLRYASRQAARAGELTRDVSGPMGRLALNTYDQMFALAADKNFRLLTDAGLVDLHQGTRAAFGDPWLFHMLVETGRLDPRAIRERIDSQHYDAIVTTSDLLSPEYDTNPMGLPKVLAERARARYSLLRTLGTFRIYGRIRPLSTGTAPAIPPRAS